MFTFFAVLFLGLTILIPKISELVVHAVVCSEKESCIFESIVEDGNETLHCQGYRSCFRASTIEQVSPSWIHCPGSYSCYEAEEMHIFVTQNSTFEAEGDGQILCKGLYSCANIDYISTPAPKMTCQGEKSCFGSRMELSSSNHTLSCTGDQSCANTAIVNAGLNSITAHLAGMNGNFDSFSAASSTTYIFKGTYSGYNATINCVNTCWIYCYANGCSNLNLVCNSSVCTPNVLCFGNEENDLCSSGYNLEDIKSRIFNYNRLGVDLTVPLLIDSEYNVPFSTVENSYESCYTPKTNALTCDDASECAGDIINAAIWDNYGPVCCSGEYSCNQALNITSAIAASDNLNDGYDIDLIRNVSIRCDARFSCSGSNHVRLKSTNVLMSDYNSSYSLNFNYSSTDISGGNIYLTAHRAATKSIIETTNDFDIFCTGTRACEGTLIKNARNVYCNGRQSCSSNHPTLNDPITEIYNIYNNVYGYADVALTTSVINLIRGDLYCASAHTCSNATITNVYGNVYGIGYSVLYDANVTNTTNVKY